MDHGMVEAGVAVGGLDVELVLDGGGGGVIVVGAVALARIRLRVVRDVDDGATERVQRRHEVERGPAVFCSRRRLRERCWARGVGRRDGAA